ncbi:MAG: hypothetical protein HYV45_00440 [Candidatus Moranbacteria bacterium]|nr:hypothetical protein [Candidatus Moranbacteria bacterium]
MSFTFYLWGIRLFTLLSFFSWMGIIFMLDPEEAGRAGSILFFLSFFTFTIGVMTLFLMYAYRRALGGNGVIEYIGSIFRQATLLGMCCVGGLILQYMRVMTWWSVGLLIATLLLLELSFRRIFSAK